MILCMGERRLAFSLSIAFIFLGKSSVILLNFQFESFNLYFMKESFGAEKTDSEKFPYQLNQNYLE